MAQTRGCAERDQRTFRRGFASSLGIAVLIVLFFPFSESGKADEPQEEGHWSFQPVERPPLPIVQAADWPRTPIDRFILAKLEANGLSPAPPADKRTLLRRVTYDLTGLPPTPEEIEAFLADTSPEAFEKVVDRLLASPHYGERWARHWLDVVRFAETTGHEYDFDIPHVWRYRDSVIRAFNDDVPYNRFVMEHIAGDLLDRPRLEPSSGINQSALATAFWWFGQQKSAPVDLRAEECDRIDDQIDVFSKAFLGLTIACARCHDHKFDPVTIEDYYALAGYLKSSRRHYGRVDDPEPTERILASLTNKKAALESLLKARLSISDEPTEFPLREEPKWTTWGIGITGAWLLAGCAWIRKKRWSMRTLGLFCLGTLIAGAGGVFLIQPQNTVQQNPPQESPLKSFLARSAKDFTRGFPDLDRSTSAREFLEHREAIVDRLEAVREAGASRTNDVVFEDFEGDSYHRWSVTGEAFGSRPTRGGEFLLSRSADRPIERFLEPGIAHSGLISGNARGAIRSEDFQVNSAYIHYRMSRRRPSIEEPASPKPNTGGRPGQVHLIVDGLSENLIFSDEATVNADQGEPFFWYQQEVEEAWMGHRAYIEILDDDDGFIAVDRIVFSDNPLPPPDVPGRLLIDVLDDPSINSPHHLADALEKLLAQTVGLWVRGDLAESEEAADFVMLLNWLWQRGLSDRPKTEWNESPPWLRVSKFLDEVQDLESQIEPPRLALVTMDGTPHDELLLRRGDHQTPGPEVSRRWPKFLAEWNGLSPPPPQTGSGRLELARWLTDDKNPLFARVMVNRLWQRHFGEGLVRTPDDFGSMGEPPTHPALLDYLASEFRQQGYSLKAMHREMVLSSGYRMSSALDDPKTKAADPANRLLHRMPLRRLEAEAIRDAMLAISGRLDTRMHGPGVATHLTPYMHGRGRPERSGPLDGEGRRSLYLTVRRGFLPPMLTVFGFPPSDGPQGSRPKTNVPAQALTLMNNGFVLQQSRLWSERLLREPHRSDESRIRRMYEMAYARLPSEEEIRAAQEFLAETDPTDRPQLWMDLCHVLLNGPEFIYLR